MRTTTIFVRDPSGEFVRLVRRLVPPTSQVLYAETGTEVIQGVQRSSPDLLFLDFSGLDICVSLREMGHMLPIIVVGSAGKTEEVVRALDLGADDYVTLPFSLSELAARVRALLRRSQGQGVISGQEVLQSDDGYLRMNVEEHQIFAGERLVSLTKTEFAFLHYLMIHAGRVVANCTLLKAIWGPEYGEERGYTRVYVRQIRCKLEPDPAHPIYIRTVPGVGYIFPSASSPQKQVNEPRLPPRVSETAERCHLIQKA